MPDPKPKKSGAAKPAPATKSAPAKPAPPDEAAKAFALIEPELEGVSETATINVNIPRAVAVVTGAAPHIVELRDRIVEELPKHPIDQVDKLMTYAFAAWYAHLLTIPAPVGTNALKEILEAASPLREDLLVAAEALARKDYLDRARVAEIRSGHGHLDTANDLVALAALFAEAWSRVENKTTVEWADVERASKLGPELLLALGARNQPAASEAKPTDPAERRARAFTLLVHAYDSCRRAVSYLRWDEDDADDIAPSLRANRGGGRKAPVEGEAREEGEGAPQAGEDKEPQ